ncbi:MAG: restriction endonuclease [Alphaproteobacteria bacterium]|nr:restriction endonuclease [Alphaproteobacteria bacterium]
MKALPRVAMTAELAERFPMLVDQLRSIGSIQVYGPLSIPEPRNYDVYITEGPSKPSELRRSYPYSVYFVPTVSGRHRTRLRAYEVESDDGPLAELCELAERSMASRETAEGLPYSPDWSKYQAEENITRVLIWTKDAPHCFLIPSTASLGALLVVPAELATSPASIEHWVLAAFRYFQSEPDSDRTFDSVPNRWADEAWMARATTAANAKLRDAREEFSRATRAFESQERELSEQVEACRAEGERTVRRLLTSNGDALRDAVVDALQKLGMTVTVPASENTDEKREDLLLEHRNWGRWTASVEVKGWSRRGLKMPEVTKLGTRARRRGSTTGILIVNAEFSRPMAQRHAPFQANEEGIENAQVASVLVIDTRHLFQALEHDYKREELELAMHHKVGVFGFTGPASWDQGGSDAWLVDRDQEG